MSVCIHRLFSVGVLGVTSTALFAMSAATSALASPQNDYMLECQGCHQPNGSGSIGSVPDLRDTIGLFLGVPGGREFLVRVPGSAQSSLSNARLAEVLNWMIETFGPSEVAARFTRFTAGEVARSRQPLNDVEPVRNALMRRIEAERTAARSSQTGRTAPR